MFPAKHYESLAFQIASEIWGIQEIFYFSCMSQEWSKWETFVVMWLAWWKTSILGPIFLDKALRIRGLFWQRIGAPFGDSVILLVLQFIRFWRICFGNNDLSVWIIEEASHKQRVPPTCTHFRTFSWNVCSGLWKILPAKPENSERKRIGLKWTRRILRLHKIWVILIKCLFYYTKEKKYAVFERVTELLSILQPFENSWSFSRKVFV